MNKIDKILSDVLYQACGRFDDEKKRYIIDNYICSPDYEEACEYLVKKRHLIKIRKGIYKFKVKK